MVTHNSAEMLGSLAWLHIQLQKMVTWQYIGIREVPDSPEGLDLEIKMLD